MQSLHNLRKVANLTRVLPPIHTPSSQTPTSRVLQSEQKNLYQGVNQILVYPFNKNNIFFVPAYLRIKINRINGINYLEGRAQIQSEIRIWIMMNHFPQAVQKEIIAKGKFAINDEDEISLAEVKIKPDEKNGKYIKNISNNVTQFRIKKILHLDIQNDPFWSPFQLINLVAYVRMEEIQIQEFDSKTLDLMPQLDRFRFKNATIKFNFMDSYSFFQFSFGQLRHLGVFDLAENLVDIQFSNKSFNEIQFSLKFSDQMDESQIPLNLAGGIIGLQEKVRIQKLQKREIFPQEFSYGRILIPLYKFPGTTIINVFVPFYILAIISLGVFFQNNDFTNRTASIATLQIAFIAFFPTIRSSLPEIPKIVFAQILIYIEATCSLICFGESLYINKDPDFVFTWNENIPFLICLSLTVINIAIIIFMFVIHKCIWQPQYNKLPEGSDQLMKKSFIDTDNCEQWWNEKCEEQFRQAINIGVVQPAYHLHKKKASSEIKATRALIQKRKTHKFQNLHKSGFMM